MSGNLCFICNEPNYNGNETLIEVRRVERDEANGSMKTIVWSGMACDACLRKHLGLFSKVVSV